MTHAELELERLKEAFEKFAEKFPVIYSGYDANGELYEWSQDAYPGWQAKARACSAEEFAALFFPFVAYVLNDMQGSAEKTAMLNRFKASLGMELMAHEMFGVEK